MERTSPSDSYHALDYALRFAKLADGVLIVAHFVHVPSGDIYTTAEWPRTFEEARARAKEMLAELHAKRLEGYPKTELVVDIGVAGRAADSSWPTTGASMSSSPPRTGARSSPI